MLIETYDEVYAVMQHFYEGLHMDSYVCKRKSDQQLYLIVRVRNKKITAKIIEFISVQKSSQQFADLVDQFVFQGDLHVVFRYVPGMPLQKKLEQLCTLEERMAIGRKLLEQMILLKQPPYFQCQCLSPENVMVTDSLDISFRYNLQDAEKYDAYTPAQALAYLYRILKILFQPELQRNVIDPMAGFLSQLQRQEYPDYLEQYRLYCDACEEVREIPENELGVSKNLFYRIWNFVRSIRGLIRRAMLTLIFMGVFIYMVYSVYMSFQIKGYVRHFESIGTMQIDEHVDTGAGDKK